MTPSSSGSPPPAQGIQVDETRLPQGHCRYILITPGVKGNRCGCVSFVHNKAVPGAICDCGHLSCFHLHALEQPSPISNREIELLKQRVQSLEEQTDWGDEAGLGGVLNRVSQAEEAVEKNREDMLAEIKASYKSISGAWELIGQLQARVSSFEETFRVHNEQLSRAGKELQDLRNRHLELLDSDESLEERIEKLEDAGSRPSLPDSSSQTTEETASSGLFTPLGTPGGPAPSPTETRPPAVGNPARARPIVSKRPGPCELWTVHVSLLPSSKQQFPFEKDSTAYKRCLSRGLHKMVAVEGIDGPAFVTAVSRAFRVVLQGRAWAPLQAKVCDGSNVRDLPMLSPLEKVPPGNTYDIEFLRQNCATCDEEGRMEAIYIALRNDELSWDFLKKCPVYVEGLGSSWTYDKRLDGSDRVEQNGMLPPPATSSPGSLKRSASDISRFASLGSTATGMHESDGPRSKVARTCMAGMVEMRRGLGTAS
ncbi:hypothetical protein S40285_05294 [Stachybotrys chlorohalonatus IBT 40285]|uniref:Uncharacterized protein n=1 Tax=Stachybotrys chlorohalonatus (strain IBT 40285) TaxID=1283841 RepID=A0A084QL80_STAC4|nr:hypothetical protein S40285_05294 [Stachybotrys chlorohalonata IBT 40285]